MESRVSAIERLASLYSWRLGTLRGHMGSSCSNILDPDLHRQYTARLCLYYNEHLFAREEVQREADNTNFRMVRLDAPCDITYIGRERVMRAPTDDPPSNPRPGSQRQLKLHYYRRNPLSEGS